MGRSGELDPQRLADHGVAEVMVAWRAELGLDHIDEAARWL